MPNPINIPIQAALLLDSNKTLRDIKSETLLCFIGQLLEEYFLTKSEESDKKVITVQTEQNSENAIEQSVYELEEYLKENVIHRKTLFKLFREASQNKQSFVQAKKYEPFGVYYEKLGKLLQNYIPKGGLFMPEYLAFLLMHHYIIQVGQPFLKYSFIQEYNLQELLAIYGEVNIKMKKDLVEKHPNTRLWEHRTVFDQMDKIASKMIEEYVKFQYKLNVNRVSKTRKKK